ncbi:peptidase M24, structural domain-containing protein [Irpex rosettiformis]|uniref:Peptidase M24, structural domain-containing protein n=1 Tax=Irpex rosettiformis TaxID=378272 RepID=A0ACB8U4W5_9APHY|nr:peptidase M24, structural domain-containing protein [Irpex rosettiformis]
MSLISCRLSKSLFYRRIYPLKSYPIPSRSFFASQAHQNPQHQNIVQQPTEECSIDEDEVELKLEDHGSYDIIFPSDPLAAPTSRSPTHHVPSHIVRPSYVPTSDLTQRIRQMRESVMPKSSIIRLGGEEEKKLREAARLAEQTLTFAGSLVQEGITTDEIDAKVHDYIISHGAYPSPLLYKGYPKSCCTSVNNIMVHGIPDSRPLGDGDIVNIDITVYLDGYHGDTSKTFLVGNVDELARELVQTTEQALEVGIAACAPLRPFRNIGKAIHNFVKGKDLTISAAFTGHGIGTTFHCLPWIIHTPNIEPGTMQPGHCFTIEPCIVRGTNADHMVFGDGWTASSTNWARSAQAEHMVLITNDGAEVLTRSST